MVEYSNNSKSCCAYNLATQRTMKSRNAIFIEMPTMVCI